VCGPRRLRSPGMARTAAVLASAVGLRLGRVVSGAVPVSNRKEYPHDPELNEVATRGFPHPVR